MSGGVSLGMFLTDIKVLSQIGASWGGIYRLALQIQTTFPALERITRLLNLPVDVGRRMELADHFLQASSELRQQLLHDSKKLGGLPIDLLPIKVGNLKIPMAGDEMLNYTNVLEIRQGKFVSVVGPPGEGKSTLLEIIGGVTLPKIAREEIFFIPSHLRLLHVSSEKQFFIGTLLQNLTFGVTPNDSDGDIDRVCGICKSLKLTPHVINKISSEEVQPWKEILSRSQSSLLCIARALIANPEVLIMHKPTEDFDDITSRNILGILQNFVRQKGIHLDATTRRLRRPRTCIITTSKVAGCFFSDQVWHVSNKFGIKLMKKEEVTPAMLA
eukprot:gnl/TRDRNA2_/TRDRNA2_162772_c0_seq2.p1 gnl/TRDRNA2_/TRDRNA2_162772_c0~~gnl/TRDRNA2_/TRDRNA2_162772_c0_seq2.p1  ORF type:complete len:340 (-),score=65.44 gnl/TRDRNA2_/TRDRNA2_162772_c0_seq2:9-995(-)